jgi:hypothetical protein
MTLRELTGGEPRRSSVRDAIDDVTFYERAAASPAEARGRSRLGR